MKRSNSWIGYVLLCLAEACGSDNPPTRAQQVPVVANQSPAAGTSASVAVQPTVAVGAAGGASTLPAGGAGRAASEFVPTGVATGVAGVGLSAVAGSSASSMQAATLGAAGSSVTPPKAGSSAAPTAGAAATSGGTPADVFCDKYGMYCGYAKPNRHADRAACLTDFNATPAQQFCKSMHIDTAIAGTAAACNGMPSEFCFSIHCLHAAGITDPTGTTYCK